MIERNDDDPDQDFGFEIPEANKTHADSISVKGVEQP